MNDTNRAFMSFRNNYMQQPIIIQQNNQRHMK
jgi:hypothetical protein